MTKEAFNYLVANPIDISATEIKALEATTKQFPYCQMAHTLLAKGYHIHYSEELSTEKIRQAAAHALSRDGLRKLINGSFNNQIALVAPKKFESIYLHKFDNIVNLDLGDFNLEASENQPSDNALSEKAFLSNSSAIEDMLLHDIAQMQQLQSSIIDNFLLKDPGLIRTTKSQLDALGKQADLSANSSKLEKNVVTESYAKILTMQGRKEKAIKVYEKLILKFPEKKTYFASKIQELA